MRYILYARKSSESEDRQVQSIDDQLRELRSLATHRSLSIVDEMMESKSAKVPGARPVFAQALRKIQDGEAEAILCWSINRLSRNPFYYGWFASGGKLYKGAHEPMVTRDEFDRVQNILHRAHHAQPQKKEFAFTGLIQCGACGCLITAEERIKRYASTGHISRCYVYYYCTGARGCSKQSVSEQYIEEQIAALLEECTLSPTIANWIQTVLVRDLNGQPSTHDKMEEQRQRVLTQARMNLERLFQLRIDQEISRDEFTPRKERLDAEIARLEQDKDDVVQKRIQQRQSLANALEFSATAYERFTRGGVRRRREVASILATGYFLTLGKLEIRPHPLLDAIRTFEPLKVGSGKQEEGPLDSQSPEWCYLRDNIRYALETNEPGFPDFPD